jgi:N-acyl-D-amino-acid deacylase
VPLRLQKTGSSAGSFILTSFSVAVNTSVWRTLSQQRPSIDKSGPGLDNQLQGRLIPCIKGHRRTRRAGYGDIRCGDSRRHYCGWDGFPKYRADLAIKDGRVALISGHIKAGGAKELDATGCMVAPGAVDLHTHYDAQLNWDPYASLSGWFGVTSISIGQCGFGFAPTRPEDRELNMRMMNRIEAIPLRSMQLGMRWDWITFPEYLDSLDRQGLGVNVGALVPFSPLRGYVLGMIPSRQRTTVTDAELNQMKRILYEAMQAGAFGFSADKNLEDRTEDGSALPSHVASPEEFLALAEVLSEFGVGHLGWTIGISDQRQEQQALLTEMMVRSGRPSM